MIPEHLVFIDLETTDTNTLHDRVTEVGFCEVHNGEVIEEWSSLVNPGKTISPFIEQITGITTAMVADTPRFSELKDLGGDELEGLYGMFRTRRQAETALREIILAHGLCNRTLGLEKGKGACFNFQIKTCRGACTGQEPLPLHEARLVTAFASMKVRSWPYAGAIGIREKSATDDRSEIHVFNHWCHLGTADSEDRLWEILDSPDLLAFDLDGYKILTRFLEKKGQIIDFIDLSHPVRAARLG